MSGQGLAFEGSAGDLGGESQSAGSVAAQSLSLDGCPVLSQSLFFEEGSEAGALGGRDPSHAHPRTPNTHAALARRTRTHAALERSPHPHSHAVTRSREPCSLL